MITSIYIQDFKIDLYEDDNIEIKSSIAEIQDITKVFTDSSNSFSVPATENNNKAFKHFYNAKLLNGWDVLSKVKGVIELNGTFYKEVKISLNNVILKSNNPTSYNIQAFGLLSDLKDILGDDKLNSLDLSAYDFAYNSTNVINYLTQNTTSPPDIINTTLSTKRLIYNSDSGVDNTDTIINIANNNTNIFSGLPFDKTNTSILELRILEAIETKYGLTFSRDFFGTSAFNNSYLLLNGNDVDNKITEQVVFDDFTADPTLENDRILLSTNLPFSGTHTLRISISCQGNNRQDEFTSIIKANGVEIHSVTANGNGDGLYVYLIKPTDFDVFENLTFHFKSSSILEYRFTVDRYITISSPPIFYKSERGYDDLEGNFIVSEKMPDLKVLDYISGLFKAYKLIAINTSETNIFVDSLDNYYRTGVVKNIDKYIDNKEIPISTGKIFNEINYKFKEPQTLLQKQFFTNNGVYYGDLEYKLVDENGKLVDGDAVNIELPFENMIYEKISDNNGLEDVNFMYGYMANDSLDPVNVKAHRHYYTNISTNESIKVLDSATTYTLINRLNVPIHTLGLNVPQYANVFGEEFNEYNGIKITNTLYSNFHKTYIDNAFNSQKRLYKIKCKNLPIDFLLSLKLNDILEFKEDYYRINKYNLNLITKECNFELYNIKDLQLEPLFNLTVDNTIITADNTTLTVDTTITKEIEIPV